MFFLSATALKDSAGVSISSVSTPETIFDSYGKTNQGSDY